MILRVQRRQKLSAVLRAWASPTAPCSTSTKLNTLDCERPGPAEAHDASMCKQNRKSSSEKATWVIKTGGFALASWVFRQLFPALLDARGPDIGLVESLPTRATKYVLSKCISALKTLRMHTCPNLSERVQLSNAHRVHPGPATWTLALHRQES